MSKLEILRNPTADVCHALGSHANDYIFHTHEFFEIFDRAKNIEAVGVLVSNESTHDGYFNAFKMKANQFLPSIVQSRHTIFASPILNESAERKTFYDFMLPEIAKRFKDESLFVEWRNSEPPDAYRIVFEKHGWSYLPYQNYLINVERDVEQIWKSIDKYARGNIQKAKSKGVVVRTVAETELDESYNMIFSLYTKKRIPLFDKSVFQDAYRLLAPKGMLRVTVAIVDDTIVGTRWGLLHNGIVFDWYAASDRGFSNCYPNEVLAWDLIEYGATNGFKVFDFGGAGIKGEHYGPAKFKQKFNGELVEHGRFYKAFRPRLYRTMSYLYEKRKQFAESR